MIASDFLGIARRLGLGRRSMALVIGVGVLQALFEAGAILLLLPVMQYIQAGADVGLLVSRHWYWAHIVSVFSTLGQPVSLAGLLAIAFVSIIGRQAMQVMQRMIVAASRTGLVRTIRLSFLDAAMRAELAAIEGDSTGRLVAEVSTETETAVTALFYSLQILVLASIFAVYLVSLLGLSWQMTSVAMIVLGLTVLAVRPILRRSSGVGAAVSITNQDVSSFLVERLRSIRLVRLERAEVAERLRSKALLDRQSENSMDGERLAVALPAIVEPVFIGLAFVCLWFGASRLGLGLDTLGVFLVIVLRLVPIGKDLIGARQVVLQTTPSLQLVDRGLARLRAARERNDGTITVVDLKQGVRFEGVGYTYSDGRVALDGIDLWFPAGQTTALVGPSGGGKSTLVDLLPRLRQPSAGRITLDGHPLDDYELDGLRHAIAFVSQAPLMFDGTIADHVRYGAPAASDADVERALRLAQAWDFVSAMPNGVQTRIGESGGRLSGGQRQRVDLARALVQRAPILILDEPTSALDAESDLLFRRSLDDIRRELAPTVIVVAHRLATISAADQIVVIDQGKVVEHGTHTELLARAGWYARAWTTQSTKAA